MYSFIKAILVGAIVLSMVTVPTHAKELVIVPDISDSVPITIEQHIADQAASLVHYRVARMKVGDIIRVRSVGTYGAAAQTMHANIRLSRKARPHKVAKKIYRLIRSLPTLVRNKRVKLQSSTNILGFLEAIGPSLDCKKVPTTILILSDGIEHSAYISGHDLVSGKKELPAPSGPILKGCTLEIHGLGQQRVTLNSDPRWFPRLRKSWARFAKAAGVARFLAYAEYQ